MYRVDLGEEVDGPGPKSGRRHGTWHWRCDGLALEGFSHQPLLDACREIKRMGGDSEQLAGLFRDGKSEPDLWCSVAWGADHTVSEPSKGNGPRFVRWVPFDPKVREY